MKIAASLTNQADEHTVLLSTNGKTSTLHIPAKSGGQGSSVNGGELLLLSLATCYCNDLYREAARKGITLTRVEVSAEAEFGLPGEPGNNFVYSVQVESDAKEEEIQSLLLDTDRVAEIHNTLRKGATVTLTT